MGGNALSEKSIRLTAEEYRRYAQVVTEKLSHSNRQFSIIRAYRTKPSFGDMDILIEGGTGFNPFAIAELLNAVEVHRNGDVTSIGVELERGMFQVDLISNPVDSFGFAERYFGFNDLGNLAGRPAKSLGFKLAHDGLKYVIRVNETQVLEELVITTDWGKALSFLGWSAEEYERNFNNGFTTLEDIFTFIASTPYFNPSIFLLENRNATGRIRDKKRATYRAMLQWCADAEPGTLTEFDYSDRATLRATMLEKAFIAFPEFKTAYDVAMKEYDLEMQFKQRFNGDIVSSVTGLVDKELGARMKAIISRFGGKKNLRTYVLSVGDEAVKSLIVDKYD